MIQNKLINKIVRLCRQCRAAFFVVFMPFGMVLYFTKKNFFHKDLNIFSEIIRKYV